jgi:hypothetical protein
MVRSVQVRIHRSSIDGRAFSDMFVEEDDGWEPGYSCEGIIGEFAKEGLFGRIICRRE